MRVERAGTSRRRIGGVWALPWLLLSTLGAVGAALAAEYTQGFWFWIDPLAYFPVPLVGRALPAGLGAGLLLLWARRGGASAPPWAWAVAQFSLGALAGLLVRMLLG